MNDHQVRLEIFHLLYLARIESHAFSQLTGGAARLCESCDGKGIAEFMTACGCWYGFQDLHSARHIPEGELDELKELQARILRLASTFKAKARPTLTQWAYWMKDKNDPRAYSAARIVRKQA